MRIHGRASPFVACLLVVAVATAPGCRSMHTVKPDITAQQPGRWSVKPGDDIRVTLKDGRTLRLTVASVEGDAIVAQEGTRVPFTEIQTLERRQFSAPRTVGLVAGGVLAALLALAVAVVAAMDSAWTSG
jgi:hypothetical protein